MTDDFELQGDSLEAFTLLENTDKHYFVTGRAGTGKSTLLKYFKEHTKKETVVLAPTGVAAVNVGGSTIHSFFKFAPGLPQKEGIFPDNRRSDLFNSLECLIIDEVSMVRADIMDAIDQALRVNKRNMYEPFGGVQVILFGDLFQLPPVVESTELQHYFDENFGGPYFFNAAVFNPNAKLESVIGLLPIEPAELNIIELHKIYRQKDTAFKDVLEKIRNNNMDFATLDTINSRYQEDFTIEDALTIILTTNNRKAAAVNSSQLSALEGKSYKYNSKVKGAFEERNFPADNELILKEGAQVMLLQNDPEKRWQNGTLGIVVALDQNEIIVNINGDDFKVEPAVWRKIDFTYDRGTHTIQQSERGSFTQYPLKLAWAITIHKSQGQTFDNVIIDLDRGAFAHGQTYVALSRCRTMQGITLTKPVRFSDVQIDDRIVEFMNNHKLA